MFGNSKQKTYKSCGGAGVLECAGASSLLQSHLGLHTCDRLGVLVKGAVAARNSECVLRSLHSHRSLTDLVIDEL